MARSSIKTSALVSYSIILFNIVAGLIYTPWMISKIGRESYGLYVLVTSFLAYFTVDYGMWQSVSKLVAEHHSKGETKQVNDAVSVASTIYLAVDLCIAVALAVVYFHIGSIFTNLTPAELTTFKTLYLVAAGFAICSFPFLFLQGVFMGRELFVPIQFCNLAKKVGVIVVTVSLLWLNFGVIALVVAFGLVPFCIHVFEAFYLRRDGVRVRVGYFKKALARAIVSLSAWLFLIVISELFITNVSPSVLARYSNTTQISIFAIGLALYNYVYHFSGALNGLFLPKIYKLKNRNDTQGLNRVSNLVSNAQMFIVGLFSIGILTLGQQFIHLWVGPQFAQSYYVACFLLLPLVVTLCQSVEGTQLMAENKLHYNALLYLCTALTSVALSVWLCPRYGATGSAIAICISSSIFLAVGRNVVYRLVLRRDTARFVLMVLRYLLAFAAVYVAFTTVSRWWLVGESWGNFLVKGAVYVCFYFIATYFIALAPDVKQRFIHPVFRLGKP